MHISLPVFSVHVNCESDLLSVMKIGNVFIAAFSVVEEAC